MSELPHEPTRETTRVRVAVVDVDSSQRIHFTAMFRWFEVAEHALMRKIGLPYATALREYKMPRVHLDCDFRGAVVFDDLLDVEARVDRVGTSSWTIAFTARQASEGSVGSAQASAFDGAVVAEGHMTIVALDYETERPVPLPPRLRAALLGESERAGSAGGDE